MNFLLLIAGIVALLHLSVSDIYPTIFWDRRNPMFKEDLCNGEGFANIYVDLVAKITFACPKNGFTSMFITEALQRGDTFENLYMVTEEEFRTCNVTKLNPRAGELVSERTRLVMLCNDPRSDAIGYHEFYLRSSATGPQSFVFKPHETYYFISTSSGSERSLQSLEHGHCKSHNMRVAIHICPQNTGCHKCKNLCCPSTNGTAPPTTVTTRSTPPYQTPAEKLLTTPTGRVGVATAGSSVRVESTTSGATFTDAPVTGLVTREEKSGVVLPVAARRQDGPTSSSYATTSALTLLFVGIGVGAGLTVLVAAAVRYFRRRRSKPRAEKLPQRDSMALSVDQSVSVCTTLTRPESQYRHGLTDLKRLLSTVSSNSSGDRSSNVSDCI